jgi:iron complex outermembrane recepter protein
MFKHRKCVSRFSLAVALLIVSSARTGVRAATDTSPGTSEPATRPTGSTISGVVTTEHSKKPIVGAQVEIAGQNRVARTDGAGRFSLGGLPAGTYLVSVTATGYGSYATQVPVDGTNTVPMNVVLDVQFHEEKVIVTASTEARDPLQVYQPTDVLGQKELDQRAGVSLGQTLSNEPGIAQTNLGSAPARPVIRGLGGDRVLILEDGVRIGDVSSISPDHTVAADPAGADRIEVVRGPANLLYGSNAIGGVINILGNEIPSRLIDRPTGSLFLSGGSNANEFSSTGDFEASSGPVAYRLGGSHREADNFDFNGGVAGNSQYDIDSGHAGVSLVGPAGSAGIAYRSYDANYGIPVSDAGALVCDGCPGVTLDVKQHSVKARGELDRPFGPLKGLRLEAAHRNYDHAEIEDTGEVGTKFTNDTTEIRVDATQKDKGKWRGSFGLWHLDQDFSAAGEEVLVPSAKTKGLAGFVYEELAYEKIRYLFGGRFESQSIDSIDQSATPVKKDFDTFSAAVGTIVTLSKPLSLAVNLTRSAKVPSAEELFANGPHAATFAFELGDPTLNEETSYGADVTLRSRTKRFSSDLTLFESRFNDFIFISPTGLVDAGSGLPIFAYGQADADIRGLEWHGDLQLKEHLILELLADTLRGQNRGTDEPLPQMTPSRAGLGLRYENDRFFVAGETRVAARQTRTAPLETETGGYTLYNLFGGYTLVGKGIIHRFGVRLENLSDKLYRNHVSLVKDLVPQPGRNIQLTYRLQF